MYTYCTEFWCMRRAEQHLELIVLHHLHDLGAFVGYQIIVLEDQYNVRILPLHILHKIGEIV